MSSEKTLADVLQGFETTSDIPDITLHNLSSNSQLIAAGDVFMALQGVSRHGIDFCLNVAKSQAAIVLYDSQDDYALERLVLLTKQMTIDVLGVANLNKIYGEIISRFYAEPSKKMTLIGVTGTDGKTSVTHLLTQALTRLGEVVGSIGTIGVGIANKLTANTHTTPDASAIQAHLADFHQQGCEIAVMEVSSHALHQYRVVGCEFDMALLTNLGSDHLDYHQNLSNYADAKERLFHWDSLTARVINQDDSFGQSLALKFDQSTVVGYSASLSNQIDALDKNSSVGGTLSVDAKSADVQLVQVIHSGRYKFLTIQSPKGEIKLKTQLIGDFNIENILALISALVALDYDVQQIHLACDDLHAIPGRMEQIQTHSTKQVIVDFAHTAQALNASLNAAKNQTQGKLICVFGCGGDRDVSKRPEMGAIAEKIADLVIITDDNPRHENAAQITRDILSGCKQPDLHQVIHDRKQAIEFAIQQAEEHDTVLIAGKGHESVQIIRDSRIPFSDQYVARQCLQVVL